MGNRPHEGAPHIAISLLLGLLGGVVLIVLAVFVPYAAVAFSVALAGVAAARLLGKVSWPHRPKLALFLAVPMAMIAIGMLLDPKSPYNDPEGARKRREERAAAAAAESEAVEAIEAEEGSRSPEKPLAERFRDSMVTSVFFEAGEASESVLSDGTIRRMWSFGQPPVILETFGDQGNLEGLALTGPYLGPDASDSSAYFRRLLESFSNRAMQDFEDAGEAEWISAGVGLRGRLERAPASKKMTLTIEKIDKPSGGEWWRGGTLQEASVSGWSSGLERNKLATAAEWLGDVPESSKLAWSLAMVLCVDLASADARDSEMVSKFVPKCRAEVLGER